MQVRHRNVSASVHLGVEILAPGCVCGHDHRTARGESVDLCLECQCNGWDDRCQNCGESAVYSLAPRSDFSACSMRCLAQLRYAQQLQAVA